MNIVSRFLKVVVARPRAVLSALCMLFAFSLWIIPSTQVINNVDYFHIEGLQTTIEYDLMREEFGYDEFFMLMIEGQNLLNGDVLHKISELTIAFESLDGVRKARSITNVEKIRGEQDSFTVGKLLENLDPTKEQIKELRKDLSTNPLYKGQIASSKIDSLSIIVWPEDRNEDDNFRKQLLLEVDKVLLEANLGGSALDTTLAGWTVTNIALSKYSIQDIMIFVPLSFVTMLLVIGLVFKNLRYTWIALLTVSASFVYVMALYPLLSVPITNISSAAIPIIICLSVADTIHLFNYLRSRSYRTELNPSENVLEILIKAFPPCFLTSLTTCLGFFSFCGNDLEPLAQFGLLAGVGMMLELLVTFTFLPVIILMSKDASAYFGSDTPQSRSSGFLLKLGKMIREGYVTISVLTGVLFLFLAALVPGLRSNSSVTDLLDSSLPERQAIDTVEEKLGGLNTFDIMLLSDSPNLFKTPEALKDLNKIHDLTESNAEVSKVSSFATFMKEMNRAFHAEDEAYYKIPDTAEAVYQYLLIYDSEETEEFVSSDYSKARLNIRTKIKQTAEAEDFINKLKPQIQAYVPQGTELVITGGLVDQLSVSDAIVFGQIESLSLAIFFVVCVLSMALRSLKLGLFSLLPNAIPVVSCFSFMVMFGIRLDTGTSLIAAVVLGIAVDDTIHFLFLLKKKLDAGINLSDALDQVIEFKGMAIGITSLVVSCGFVILLAGSFVPTQRFGLLTALVLMVAPIADLIFLPALIYCFPSVMQKSQSQDNHVFQNKGTTASKESIQRRSL